MNRLSFPQLVAVSLAFGTFACAEETPDLDVPYVPTPPKVVDAMLDLAEIRDGDVVWDLGCGDGRLVIEAAKRADIRGVGVDLDPKRIEESKKNAAEAGVEDEVDFRQGDLFETDFSDASVLAMYLLSTVNLELRPKILELAPGTRIVSNTFDMGDWKPDETRKIDDKFRRTIHFWVVPANVSGTWAWTMGDQEGELRIDQNFQKLSGSITFGGEEYPLLDGKVEGAKVTFHLKIPEREKQIYEGEADGDTLTGTIDGETWKARREEGTSKPLEPAQND